MLFGSIATILQDPGYNIETVSHADAEELTHDLQRRIYHGAYFSDAQFVPSEGLVLLQPSEGIREGVYYPHVNGQSAYSIHVVANLVFLAGAATCFSVAEIWTHFSQTDLLWMAVVYIGTEGCGFRQGNSVEIW